MYDELSMLLAGEMNGRNMYDCSDDELYDSFMSDDSNCEGPSSEPKKPKATPAVWICKDGTTMLISDMTDKHLENSINYCYTRQNNTSVEILAREQERRKKDKLIAEVSPSKTILCQFCKNPMTVVGVYKVPEIDVGFQIGYTQFRLSCKCGAWGPIIKKVTGDFS